MPPNKILEALENLGFSPLEANVYVLLAKKGPQKAVNISKILKIQKQTLYPILKKLEKKGVLSVTMERPARFSALSIERIVDLFVEVKMEEAKLLKRKKSKILSDWKALSVEDYASPTSKFMVLEGRNYIFSKIQQMIRETERQLLAITTIPSLFRADQFGVIDTALKHSLERDIKFKCLTEISEHNATLIESWLLKNQLKNSNFEVRTPDLGLKLTNRVIIKDDNEALFFITKEEDLTTEREGTCLWTNSKTLTIAFSSLFEEFWSKSIDIGRKISEIKSGKPAPKTCIINDAKVAEKKYYEKMNEANQEIIMLTSSEGLLDYFRNAPFLLTEIAKDVSIKIMAPITKDNLDAAIQLAKHHKVKHIPNNYFRTTIVDSQHLFQFKNPTLNDKGNDLSFENAFYTDDFEYVDKTKKMLNDLWKNARVPTAITLEEITRPPAPSNIPVNDNEYSMSRKGSPYRKMIVDIDEKGGAVTSEYILNKIINAKRILARNPSKDMVKVYGSMASAVIHTPNCLGVPDMIMVFYHCNKQSSFGVEDWFQVYLWLETPKGHAYVPVAVVGDNSKSVEWRKNNYYSGTPAAQNCQLLKKDQLQVQIHGNTLFAGWTVSIPLFPPKYILPPAGLLFEGYSRLKTSVTKSVMPSGVKVLIEGNGFDSFVTLFHSKAKYSGPGTDGVIGRDMILTTYPPPLI